MQNIMELNQLEDGIGFDMRGLIRANDKRDIRFAELIISSRWRHTEDYYFLSTFWNKSVSFVRIRDGSLDKNIQLDRNKYINKYNTQN